MTDYFESDFEAWQYDAAEGDALDPFVLPLAPDRLHKANISGGPPYGVVMPSPTVDTTFVGASSEGFVDYLNDAFGHGGFPGGASGPGRDVRCSLAKGLFRL